MNIFYFFALSQHPKLGSAQYEEPAEVFNVAERSRSTVGNA